MDHIDAVDPLSAAYHGWIVPYSCPIQDVLRLQAAYGKIEAEASPSENIRIWITKRS